MMSVIDPLQNRHLPALLDHFSYPAQLSGPQIGEVGG